MYIDGTGSNIGAAFRLQFPAGWTGALSGGKLTLSAGGAGGYPLLAPDGSNPAPSFSFVNCTGCGLYNDVADGTISLTSTNSYLWINRVGASNKFQFDASNLFQQYAGHMVLTSANHTLNFIGTDLSPAVSGDITLGVTLPFGAITSSGTITGSTISGTTYVGLPAREFHVDAYDPADNSTANKLQAWPVTNASTLQSGNFTGTVVGVGAGNYVVKLCTDGATCSGANLKATCTISCTATVGTNTACTINNSAISAAATLTLEPSTACATTAEAGNFTFNLSQP